MRKIQWHDGFSVGVTLVDEQHKELIRLLNLLIENRNCGCRSDIFAEVLTGLTAYARYHFATEEELMRDHGYPDRASHAMEHTEFKHRIATFCVRVMSQDPNIVNEALTYLAHWFMHHILIEDMKFKPFFRGIAAPPTPDPE